MTRPRTLRETIDMRLEATPAVDTFGTEHSEGQASATTRRSLLIRVSADTHRDLKVAAAARGTTVQSLVLGAIALVLNSSADKPSSPGPVGR